MRGDHRRKEAKAYNDAYAAIAERHPPKDRLAAKLIGLAADLLCEYEQARTSPRTKASGRRKAAGLLLGALRAVKDGAEPEETPGEAWARAIREGRDR